MRTNFWGGVRTTICPKTAKITEQKTTADRKKYPAMVKAKKKLTPAQKRAKKKAKEERQKKYMWVLMSGKQVRVKRPETRDGLDADEFMRNNADPIWLHQNGMWEYMEQEQDEEMKPFIYNYCGRWKDNEGNMLIIEPLNDSQVHVTYIRAGDDGPLLRPWLDNLPAAKMIGGCDPEDWDASFKIELSKPGDGFCLGLDFDFGTGDYNTVAPSRIRYEKDSHFDKYSYLFGKLSPYSKQDSNSGNAH